MLAFLLELAAVAGLTRFGWRAGTSLPARALLAVIAPALWAVLWGLFFSPHPRLPLPGAIVPAGRLAMFALAALAVRDRAALAAVLAVGAVLVQLVAGVGSLTTALTRRG